MASLRRATAALAASVALLSASHAAAFTGPAGSSAFAVTPSHAAAVASRVVGRSAPRPSRKSELTLPMSSAAAVASESSEDEPLFEGLGVGIRRDVAARFPKYLSDITDGLNSQCLAASTFLFFACLAPAVGFGGLFGAATDGAIGTMEMVTSTSLCGLVYALTAAQPLTIIGSTGPVLAFVACLAQLAEMFALPFLPLYAWTGLWTSGILFASAITSSSNIVRYLTRFTDEIFSTLISAIFVVEAVSDIGRTFSSPASTFTKALLTMTCALTTFGTAMVLKSLRSTAYFTKRIRNNLSSFAPTIGVVAGSLVARSARIAHGVQVAGLPSLSIPATFATTSGRPWLVPLLDLPVWARWGALVPALMATVLLFLDQNITVRLVNSPMYKMDKGRRKGNVLDGMHADMLVVSLLTAVTSLTGLPWLVAATVRSISHVRALSKYDADGNVSGTIEQRVTGTAIHALIGACVLLKKPRQLLSQLPLPVLMGLFLYLGTSALPGNEMWERMKGLLKDPDADEPRRWSAVPRGVTTIFTAVQLACLGIMFWVKESPVGVLFPVVIAMLAPLRFGLVKAGIISEEDIAVLDAE